ncbi:DUF3868 domain-containing protein [Parabacteroides faecis]|uniref:DUF3868 domain-containing protein n=1 Tax=Parabacteroides faecis TaxID=1217282 RepID=UPI00216423C9|nr:DUF3868 domain-containing protein [Parabacteroides faecis]MCS2892296.1 DUF3868 domain-containing protein [Parabacteroides faecis]UVQ49065.1 DUF3868 domain-containing protein [Parabacteroides faecis]
MKIILYIIYMICAGWLLLPCPAKGQEPGIRLSLTDARVDDDDSLTIRLHIVLEDIRVPSSQSLIFEPRLVSGEHILALPPVVVSGKRRARYDARAHAVDPSTQIPGNNYYHRIVAPKKQARYELDYIRRIPYTGWMRNAGLSLRQISRTCCRGRVLADDLLTADLALVPPCVKEVTGPSPRAVMAYNRYNKEIRFLIPDDAPAGLRTETAIAYLDYRQGGVRVEPEFGKNPEELAYTDSLFTRLHEAGVTQFRQVMVTGYASPEGSYQHNETLARQRAEEFRAYISRRYLPEGCPVICNSVAEDWEELRRMVAVSGKPYSQAVCFIIDNYGIFEGRENYLMQLDNGAVYRKLLHDFFPYLRRVELRLTYEPVAVGDAEAARLLYSHPEMLCLADMYRVARYYPPATEQHREVYVIAAETYPENIVAQINAAAACLLLGDADTARRYLDREDVQADPRSAINRQIMLELEIKKEADR